MARKPPPENTRFKKGQSGNPEGGRKHNPIKRALKNLTIEVYAEVIEAALTCNVEYLQNMVKDPAVPAVQVGVCTALLKAISRGDFSVIEQLASRIVGKMPDKLVVDHTANVAVSFEDREKLRKTREKLLADV